MVPKLTWVTGRIITGIGINNWTKVTINLKESYISIYRDVTNS